VVITGASTGIGEACALHLDRLGFLVFAGVRKEADGERLRAEASERLTPIILDVTDGQQIAAAAETVKAVVGDAGLAGLVNNAGIALAGPLEFLLLDELRRQLEVNVVAQIAVTQAFLPLLRLGRGRVINMGSVGGRSTLPFLGPYQASKHALEALTDVLRMELVPWGIEVSIIEPGNVATPIWEKSIAVADEARKQLPPQAEELYGRSLDAIRKGAALAGKHGISPDAVAAVVEHALTAEKPKTRYLVGREARIRALVQLVPDRIRDRLILRQLSRLS
jgi:NAD(P)-dependent dehydrogenase (short-subunit alcohol dehydrogenase family)